MTIGDIIRDRRKEHNMTQEDLAKAVGTTAATVSRWESGDIHKMKASYIYKVSRVLEMDIELFFQRNEILTIDEENIIVRYRVAADSVKSAVRKLLDVPEKGSAHA